MTFWIYDPMSFKDSTLFPSYSGGLGNFLNTLTLVILGVVAALKTKYKNTIDNSVLMKYAGLSLCAVLLAGFVFCGKNTEELSRETYNFDLTYE